MDVLAGQSVLRFGLPRAAWCEPNSIWAVSMCFSFPGDVDDFYTGLSDDVADLEARQDFPTPPCGRCCTG